jgi:hypothetical protein
VIPDLVPVVLPEIVTVLYRAQSWDCGFFGCLDVGLLGLSGDRWLKMAEVHHGKGVGKAAHLLLTIW